MGGPHEQVPGLLHYLCFFYYQQRVGLKGREKEQMWKELLKILRPGQSMGPKFIIPEVDDFDPDTYGKPVEQSTEGKPDCWWWRCCIV